MSFFNQHWLCGVVPVILAFSNGGTVVALLGGFALIPLIGAWVTGFAFS